jgi:hypothetical protein
MATGGRFIDGSVAATSVGIGGTNATVEGTRIVAGGRGLVCVGPLAVDRLRIEAPIGISMNARGRTTTVTNSAIISSTVGAEAREGQLGFDRVTVVGGSGSTGVSADSTGIDGRLSMSESVVSTLGTDVRQSGAGLVTARNSAFTTFTGSVTITEAHYTGDPRFADRAAGDLRLRGDSPLIDRRLSPFFAGPFDAAGAQRIVDGDGDGAATGDLGGYERQDFSATAAAPATGVAAAAVGFSGDAPGTVPNDPLTFDWAFDDGATASGREVTHVFAAPGPHAATLTVTDGAGVKRTATVALTVDPAPAPAASPPPASPPPASPPPADTPGAQGPDLTPPAIGLSFPRQRLGRLSSKGIAVKVDASEPATLALELSIDKKTAKALGLGRRAMAVGTLSTHVAAGPRTLYVKLASKTRNALRGARKVKLALGGSARDDAGNSGPITGSATFKR